MVHPPEIAPATAAWTHDSSSGLHVNRSSELSPTLPLWRNFRRVSRGLAGSRDGSFAKTRPSVLWNNVFGNLTMFDVICRQRLEFHRIVGLARATRGFARRLVWIERLNNGDEKKLRTASKHFVILQGTRISDWIFHRYPFALKDTLLFQENSVTWKAGLTCQTRTLGQR